MNIIITVFALIFFNVAFFLLGGGSADSTAVWLVYGFIHFAGLCQIVTPLLFNEKEATVASMGMTLRLFSMLHFVVILLAGIIIMLIAPDSWKVSFLVLLLISLVYVALFVSMIVSNRRVLKQ